MASRGRPAMVKKAAPIVGAKCAHGRREEIRENAVTLFPCGGGKGARSTKV